MCKRCSNEVKEMDIRDSDLPLIPYKLVKWRCCAPGCNNHAKEVRDYGISPFYYWKRNIKYGPDWWQGGWFNAAEHGYLCSVHWKDWQNVDVHVHSKIKHKPDYLLKNISCL